MSTEMPQLPSSFSYILYVEVLLLCPVSVLAFQPTPKETALVIGFLLAYCVHT